MIKLFAYKQIYIDTPFKPQWKIENFSKIFKRNIFLIKIVANTALNTISIKWQLQQHTSIVML